MKKRDKALRPIPFFIVWFLKQSWLKGRRNTCSEILFQLLSPNTDKKLQKLSRNLNCRRLQEYGISPCFFAVFVDYAYSHIIICPCPKVHDVKLGVCEFSVFINKLYDTKKDPWKGILLILRVAGLEPARSCPREILSLLCLPIPPYPHIQLFVQKWGL